MKSAAWQHDLKVSPWPELEERYTDLVEISESMRYLLDIVQSVEASGCAESLAATTSMHDLVIADTPVPAAPLEVVIVRAPGSIVPPSPGSVRIEHLSHTGRNDAIERPSGEAVALFWRFIGEKLGVVPGAARQATHEGP